MDTIVTVEDVITSVTVDDSTADVTVDDVIIHVSVITGALLSASSLNYLTDVTLTAPLINGDALVYDTDTGQWVNAPGGMQYTEITAAAAGMAINNAYIANRPTLVTLTLPALAPVGGAVMVMGSGIGGWRVAQNAGQRIHFNSIDSTPGVGGYLQFTVRYDSVELVCINENTDWIVRSSMGNITIV